MRLLTASQASPDFFCCSGRWAKGEGVHPTPNLNYLLHSGHYLDGGGWCRSHWILGARICLRDSGCQYCPTVLRRPDPEPRKCNVTRLLDNRRGERVSIREFYRAFVTNRMSSFALCAALGTIVWGSRGLSLGEDAGHTHCLCVKCWRSSPIYAQTHCCRRF